MTTQGSRSELAWRALAHTLVCAALAALAACGDDGQAPSDSANTRDKDAASEPEDGRDASGGAPMSMRDATVSAAGSGVSGSSGTSGSTDGGPLTGCGPEPPNTVPELLSCTGLYADIEGKEVASGVRPFTPAEGLWSDGADKARWIYLPPDTQIDSSVSDDWKFPIGTKFFKEFSHKGHRVETRMFWKVTETHWLRTAYHWDAEETEAMRFPGGEVDVAGDTYYIPSAKECDQCHKGRDDRALGFEPALLGLPGATGITLAQLKDEGLLTDDSIATSLTIGDDGTTKAVAALGWLHVNCGVSCHNDNTSSEGYSSRLRLRLQAEELDGRSSSGFAAIETGVGVAARTPRWLGETRIIPGVPEQSLLYVLASTRNPAQPKDQMPPIASRVVDTAGVALVADWIRSMAPGNDQDAGD